MYIYRQEEDIFKLAALAAANKFFENLITVSIKEIAEQHSVSESQVHFWKDLLIKEGPKIFSLRKPGRKKENFSFHKEIDKLLVYESINRLLVEGRNYGGKNRKFGHEFKEKIILERDRLKNEFSLTYENFAKLIGIDSGILRLWARKLKKEGPEGLKEKSRAPKNSPKKLIPEIIKEILWYGTWWKKRYGRIKLTDFGIHFRWKYQRVLKACGNSNLANKTIARYLKEHGLYKEKEEAPKGKRGNFKYYFPGAQFFIDTTVVAFLGLKIKVIAVVDAISRHVFHQEAFLRENADNVIKCLKASFKEAQRLGIRVLSVISDHGKPYKANRVWRYLKAQRVFRILAHAYWPEDKAVIERYFRTLKEGLRKLCRVYFIKGILVCLKKKIKTGVLNFILIGQNTEYEKKKGIDGENPLERLHKEASPDCKEAVRTVFKQKEKESQLKGEFIALLCKEFRFGLSIMKVKNYLSSYPRKIIEESAEVLRGKLVTTELPSLERWYYFRKVVKNKDKERKDLELRRANEIIRQEETKLKDMEEKRKILEERRWYDTHPEEALNEVIERLLTFFGNEFALRLYGGRIAEQLKKVLMKHSSLTAGLKVNKICKRVEKKDRIESEKIKKEGYSFPAGDTLKAGKEKIIVLIHQSYLQCKDQIPAFQGLRHLL